MSKPELTPWFPSTTKPVRAGVYETEVGYQHWTGKQWGLFCGRAELAARPQSAERRSMFQNAKWRGLASDPSGTPGLRGRG